MENIQRLVWLDLEMTGLDIDTCHIIEIAVIITDINLNIIAESESIAIYQPDRIIQNMNTWCQKTHLSSGLVERVKNSKISTAAAEQMILTFIEFHVAKNSSPLCGNSVWQDRKFIAKYMPKLEKYFHYRLFDVSTFKIASALWKPRLKSQFRKHNEHTALADIRESIIEMQFYQKNLLALLDK